MNVPGTAGDVPPRMWILPHTHWDREWYEPHDVFRARLVKMVDGLLDILEAQPEYRFTLDGQSAAFEDYLEIRPENRARLEDVVARGQLAVGPFQILLDEFCCDGETIIRNLELGIHAARRVGGEMRVGYLPDMFGHAAQTPQILRGFGIKDSCMWRGIPAAVDTDAFLWKAPNGDAVRVEYQWDGYGSALKLFEPLESLSRNVERYLTTNAKRFTAPGERTPHPAMGMYGSDHTSPRPDLIDVIRSHNEAHPECTLGVATLGELVEMRDHGAVALGELPEVVGEMRSHAMGNILPGVNSVRTNMKAAMAAAERDLTVAERFDTWAGGARRRAFFDRGWGLVVESSAHDSANGCGVDSTAEEVQTRLHVASHVARGAVDVALDTLGSLGAKDEIVVFNPSGFVRHAQAERTVDAIPEELPPGVQVLETLPTIIGDEHLATKDLDRIIHRIHGQELFGKLIRAWTIEDRTITFTVAEQAEGLFDLAAYVEAVDEAVEGVDDGAVWHVLTVVPPSCRVLMSTTVDGLSARAVSVATSQVPHAPVVADGTSLCNSLVCVGVAEDGAVSVEDLRSGVRVEDAVRLEDEGDRGDSYNFGIVPGGQVSAPSSVEVIVTEVGPLRGRILLRRTYHLPVALSEADRDVRLPVMTEQLVDTTLEVRAGEPFVRVGVDFVNQVADHRLRLMVPTTARNVLASVAGGQYGLTERGRSGEGGWGEFPLPTFPATRFVFAGGTAVHVDKQTEYEVVTPAEGPDRLALTLIRSVGLMSVNIHPMRDEPAGMERPTPGAQYLGVAVHTDFAIDLGSRDRVSGDVVVNSDRFRLSFVTTIGAGDADVDVSNAGESALLAPTGDVPLESLRRLDGDLVEARFVNYLHEPRPLAVSTSLAWDHTDMCGAVIHAGVDPMSFMVPGATIVTLRAHTGRK